MAEIATIARPYAEALFKAAGAQAAALSAEVSALAAVAADEQLRQFADNPKTSSDQVFGVVVGVVN
ncbi:MAG: F0F1 ATP synthase subunit delta, partial [Rubrivivax sp.]